MSVKIILNEKKEQLNELGLLGWGVIALLIGKLLGFKFNLHSDEQGTQWGFQLGEAFKFSRQKLKNSGLSPDVQQRIEQILYATESRIKQYARAEMANVSANPGHKITVDTEITKMCDEAVNDIDSLIKDPKQSRDIVQPIRKTFDELTSTLGTLKKERVLNVLRTDMALRTRILNSLTGITDAATKNALADNIILQMAERIAASMP